jgi:TonB family protein
LRVFVGLDGRITNTRILKGLGHGLDESAMKTLKQWKCEPAIGPNGKPVPKKVPFEINFKLCGPLKGSRKKQVTRAPFASFMEIVALRVS